MCLALINKAAPQINVFFLGMPLKALAGVAVVLLTLRLLVDRVMLEAVHGIGFLEQVMRLAGRGESRERREDRGGHTQAQAPGARGRRRRAQRRVHRRGRHARLVRRPGGLLVDDRRAAHGPDAPVDRLATRPQIDPELIGRYLLGALGELALALAPVLAVAFVAAGFFTYVQIGALFTIKPLIPDMKRLNAAQNLKNLVGKDKLVELVKNLAKLGIMTCVGYAMISDQIEAVIMTPRGRLAHGTAILADAALRLGAAMIGALVVFGLADLLWQRHRHAKKLRMSKDEVKREYKQSEGDPQLKGKRRQLHQQLINDPGTRKVPDADAVVVNPTHVAVALRYRKEQMRAPKILAAGKGEVARQIKWLARRHQIPIVRNVPLARGSWRWAPMRRSPRSSTSRSPRS